jgi:hypothetical protein
MLTRYISFVLLEVSDLQWHAMMQPSQSASSLDEVRPRYTFWLHNKGPRVMIVTMCCCAVLQSASNRGFMLLLLCSADHSLAGVHRQGGLHV